MNEIQVHNSGITRIVKENDVPLWKEKGYEVLEKEKPAKKGKQEG